MAAAVRGGVDWVQIRDRKLSAAALLSLTERLSRTAREAAGQCGRRVRILMNRRLDVAMAAQADGVHLGFDAMKPQTARRLLGDAALVGVSTHSAGEVRALGKAASYVQLAPIHEPLSKVSTRAPLGTAGLRMAAAGGATVLAQGGIDAANARAACVAGAAGVCVTGAILLADDPARAASELREALDA